MSGRFERIVKELNQKSNWISLACIMMMTLLVCFDIILRFSFDFPIKGTTEIVGLLSFMVVVFGMGFCQIEKRHTSVKFVLSRLPAQAQTVVAIVTTILGICLFILLGWQGYSLAIRFWLYGEIMGVLKISPSPVMLCTVIGCAFMCLALVLDLLKLLRKLKE